MGFFADLKAAAVSGWQAGRGQRLRPDGQPVRVAEGATIKRRQSVEAMVIRGCGACGAPGRYLSDPVWASHPGVLVAAADPRCGEPVGETCPNCGAERPQNEPLGEIWIKEFN